MAENRLFGRAQPLKERAAKNHIEVDAGFMTGNDQRQKLTRREYMALLDEFQSRQIFARDLNRRHMLELGQMQSISALATALVAERCHEVQRAWRYKPHAREGAAYLYSEPLLVDLLRQDTTRLLICRSRRLQMFGIVNRLAIQPHPYSLQLSAYPLIDHKGTLHVQLGSVHKAMAASPDCTVREYEIKVDEHWEDFLSSLKLVEYMQKLHTDEELEMTDPLYLGTVLPWIKALISQDRQDQEVHYRYVLNSLFLNNRLYTDSQIRRVQEMLYGAVRDCDHKPAKTLLQMSLVLASEISDAQADMLHRLQSEHILQIEAPSSMSIREHIACMCQGTYVQIKDKESVYTIYRIVDAERTYVVHHLTPTAVHEGREEKLDAILARLDVTGALKLRGHQGLCATLPRLAAQSWETVVPNGKQTFARATVLWPTVSTVESEVSNALLKYVGGSKMKNCVTDLLMQCMQSAVRWPNFEVDPPGTPGGDGQSIKEESLQIVVASVNDCTHACKELLRSARFDVAEDISRPHLLSLSDRVEDALDGALKGKQKSEYIEKLKNTLAEWLHYMILVDYVRGGLIGIVLGMERDRVAEAVPQFYEQQVHERTQHIQRIVKLLQSGGCNLIQL